MGFYEELNKKLNEKPFTEADFEILWDWLLHSDFAPFLHQMQNVPQDPHFHGEGNVCVHTKLVCRALLRIKEFQDLNASERTELFAAALLHDVGKIRTTVLEDGKWISPRHSVAGSHTARTFLWKTCELCGTEEKMKRREVICGLIRYHMVPFHIIDEKEPVFRIRQIASYGDLAKGFSWRNLCLLAKADARGRIAADIPAMEESLELCGLLVSEAGCGGESFSYSSDYVKHACLAGRNVMPDQPLYDGTWGEIILMSGLPGTGKDSWIARNLPGLPMISLDEIRKELQVLPTQPQGAVIQEARERAKILLRKRQPFVWNATNLTKELRLRQVRLFEQYGARVRIIYLETREELRMQRNLSRKNAVPEGAVAKMLEKTEPPAAEEAQTVEWLDSSI